MFFQDQDACGLRKAGCFLWFQVRARKMIECDECRHPMSNSEHTLMFQYSLKVFGNTKCGKSTEITAKDRCNQSFYAYILSKCIFQHEDIFKDQILLSDTRNCLLTSLQLSAKDFDVVCQEYPYKNYSEFTVRISKAEIFQICVTKVLWLLNFSQMRLDSFEHKFLEAVSNSLKARLECLDSFREGRQAWFFSEKSVSRTRKHSLSHAFFFRPEKEVVIGILSSERASADKMMALVHDCLEDDISNIRIFALQEIDDLVERIKEGREQDHEFPTILMYSGPLPEQLKAFSQTTFLLSSDSLSCKDVLRKMAGYNVVEHELYLGRFRTARSPWFKVNSSTLVMGFYTCDKTIGMSWNAESDAESFLGGYGFLPWNSDPSLFIAKVIIEGLQRAEMTRGGIVELLVITIPTESSLTEKLATVFDEIIKIAFRGRVESERPAVLVLGVHADGKFCQSFLNNVEANEKISRIFKYSFQLRQHVEYQSPLAATDVTVLLRSPYGPRLCEIESEISETTLIDETIKTVIPFPASLNVARKLAMTGSRVLAQVMTESEEDTYGDQFDEQIESMEVEEMNEHEHIGSEDELYGGGGDTREDGLQEVFDENFDYFDDDMNFL